MTTPDIVTNVTGNRMRLLRIERRLAKQLLGMAAEDFG